MSTRSLVVRVAATGAAVVLVAAGCGSSSKSAGGKSSGSSATTAAVSGSAGGGGSTGGGSTGGGSGETTGITPTTITVGQLADISGPVPGLFQGAYDGMDAWAAYVNSTGGIDGRKIVVDHKDAALACNTYANGIKSLMGSVFADIGTFSLVGACGGPALKANPTFPDLEGTVLNPSIASMPNVYGVLPAVTGYTDTGYLWVKQQVGANAVQHAGDLWGAGAQADYEEQQPAAKAAGYKYVYSRGFPNTETNYVSDILRMKNAGVQVVDLLDMNVTDAVDFLQQAHQQGFQPKAYISSTAYDPDFYKLLGDPSLAKGVYSPLAFSMFLGEDAKAVPEITTMTTWFKKTHPKDPLNEFVVEGFASGLLFQQVMATMGSHPTRSGLLAALKNVHNFTADGLIAPSDVGGKQGQNCVVIIAAENGKFVRADPPSGWLCNGAFIKS